MGGRIGKIDTITGVRAMDKKAAFVFDTNFIIKEKKLDEVIANLQDKYIVYITQVSVNERIAQQCRDLKKKFNKVESIQNECGEIANISFFSTFEKRAEDLCAGVQKKYEQYFKDNIIPMSTTEKVFNEVLERSYQKCAPFSPDKNASDKGFKDTLMWISLLDYFKSNGPDKIIFITDDKAFTGQAKSLSDEFEEITGKGIEIKNSTFYKELLAPTEISEAPKEAEIPDLSGMRERIAVAVSALCVDDDMDSWGNIFQANTFSTSVRFDANMAEIFLKKLDETILLHIFEKSVPASCVFEPLDDIVDGNVGIPLTALENICGLYKEIITNYPTFLHPFYNAVASQLNCNYKQPQLVVEDGELPF